MLKRQEVVRSLLKNRGDALVVSGLGSAMFDVFHGGDSAHNFYLFGAMGGAAMIGLGLALSQPNRSVVVITGDGEMLMGMGSLATIAVQKPANLKVVVFDNGVYAETGMQPAHTSLGVDLAKVAKGCGIGNVLEIKTEEELGKLQSHIGAITETTFARILVSPTENSPRKTPLTDGVAQKLRFRSALGFLPE